MSQFGDKRKKENKENSMLKIQPHMKLANTLRVDHQCCFHESFWKGKQLSLFEKISSSSLNWLKMFTSSPDNLIWETETLISMGPASLDFMIVCQ